MGLKVYQSVQTGGHKKPFSGTTKEHTILKKHIRITKGGGGSRENSTKAQRGKTGKRVEKKRNKTIPCQEAWCPFCGKETNKEKNQSRRGVTK